MVRSVMIILLMTVDPLAPQLSLLCPRNITLSVIVSRNPVVIIVIHSITTVCWLPIVFIIMITSVVMVVIAVFNKRFPKLFPS